MMKKIFAFLLLAMVTLTSCLDSENPYEKYDPILPGLEIYELAYSQFDLAIQPAHAAFRLAILLAEAEKQGMMDTFLEVKDGDRTVKDILFGRTTSVQRLASPENAYRITYAPQFSVHEYFYEGSLLVKTGGLQLAETAPVGDAPQRVWSVECENFKIQIPGSYPAVIYDFKGAGTTQLYTSATGEYVIDLSDMDLYSNISRLTSNWGGMLSLLPLNETHSLAYSDCKGADFSAACEFSGETFIAWSDSGNTRVSYNIEPGSKYRFGGSVFVGTIICELLDITDFDPITFPSAEVRFDSVYNEKTREQTVLVTYNGTQIAF